MALKRFDEGNEENEPTSRVWVSSNQSRHHQKSFRLSVSPFLFTRRQRNDTRRRLGACRGCLRCRRCSIRFPVQLVCVGSVSLKAGVGLTSASGFDDTLVRCRKSSIRKMLGMAGILDDFFWKGFFFPGWKKIDSSFYSFLTFSLFLYLYFFFLLFLSFSVSPQN